MVSYAHIGTGNFNEKTAKIYTDFSLFTRHQEMCEEVAHVFEFVEHSYKRFDFKHLLVSPITNRQRICELIDFEISEAHAGRKAAMLIKVNNLVDDQLEAKLYEHHKQALKFA